MPAGLSSLPTFLCIFFCLMKWFALTRWLSQSGLVRSTTGGAMEVETCLPTYVIQSVARSSTRLLNYLWLRLQDKPSGFALRMTSTGLRMTSGAAFETAPLPCLGGTAATRSGCGFLYSVVNCACHFEKGYLSVCCVFYISVQTPSPFIWHGLCYYFC